MLVNADFTSRAVVLASDHTWVPSPQLGVDRVLLDRVGVERARATSVVRYAPRSAFPKHHHPGGEEILVLEGTFSDSEGDYPAGWYIRNPPGSSHQPASAEGAVIFVKLWQMTSHDERTVRINTLEEAAWTVKSERSICPLHDDTNEEVALHRLHEGERFFSYAFKYPEASTEIFVVKGGLTFEGSELPGRSWIRLPFGDHPDLVACAQGATMYVKRTLAGNVESSTRHFVDLLP